jgi:hypothetical protein
VAPDIAVDQRGEQWWQRFCQRCGEGLRLSPPQAGHADKSQAPSPVQVRISRIVTGDFASS